MGAPVQLDSLYQTENTSQTENVDNSNDLFQLTINGNSYSIGISSLYNTGQQSMLYRIYNKVSQVIAPTVFLSTMTNTGTLTVDNVVIACMIHMFADVALPVMAGTYTSLYMYNYLTNTTN